MLLIRKLLRVTAAQDTVEYCLLIVLIALTVTAGMTMFTGPLINAYGGTGETVAECVKIPGKGPPPGVPGKGPPECKGGRKK